MPAGLHDQLLEAKLSLPHNRPGGVSRAELIAKARSSDRRVVSVTAPAGYGKTTLMVQWAQAEDRPVAWASLHRLDDDPGVLLTLLASAFARISPGETDLVADVSGLGVSVLGRAAPRLASALRSSPTPFVLMLDDLQELKAPACHDALGVVMDGIPPGSQLVAASRSEQPHLPRLRASGEALEFATSDLAVDAAGAQQIFSAANVDLTPDLAAVVTDRTEGWPVGLYLAALIASRTDGEVVSVSGDDRYVADYLYRESLMHLSEDVQRFLRRTAILDQMCGSLCDSLLETSNAEELLRGLEASNLFLIPLDRRRKWYRYHELFREFLLGELLRVDPDVVAKLHLRAADWYESNGSPAMAVEHLLHTTEQDRCVQLVAALTLPTYLGGQMSTVQRWLATLGDSAIAGYPPLAVLATWVAALSGQPTEALRLAAVVDAASFNLAPARRHGLLRLRASDPPGSHVSRRSGAVVGRCEPRGLRGTAVEPMARSGAVRVRRGVPARGRRRTGNRNVRRVVQLGVNQGQHRCDDPERRRACAVGHGSRPVGGRRRARGARTRGDR